MTFGAVERELFYFILVVFFPPFDSPLVSTLLQLFSHFSKCLNRTCSDHSMKSETSICKEGKGVLKPFNNYVN